MPSLKLIFAFIFSVIFVLTKDPVCFLIGSVLFALEIVHFLTNEINKVEVYRCPPHRWVANDDGKLFCKACGMKPQQSGDDE